MLSALYVRIGLALSSGSTLLERAIRFYSSNTFTPPNFLRARPLGSECFGVFVYSPFGKLF